MISEDRLQKALTYLAETDQSMGKAKAFMMEVEKLEKMIISYNMLESTQKSNPLKESEARTSQGYKEWLAKYSSAVEDYQTLYNKRNTEITIVEVWRSLNSSRNRGNIT